MDASFYFARRFTCLNYSAAATDPEIMAYLPCPVPIIPEADGFEWETEELMYLPLNYTCGTKTYADVAPGIMAGKAFYGVIFGWFSVLPFLWIKKGVTTRGKKLDKWSVLNAQERIYFTVGIGCICQFLAVSLLCWYENAHGPPQFTLFLQIVSAYCVDMAIVLAITGWTGMNNIQGRKPVVPKKYKIIRNVAIFGNLSMQVICGGLEPYVSTNGDERVTSDLNVDYTYYDGTISGGRQLANLLTELGYVIILFIEGGKLKKTLSGGKGGDNPAAKKILKYMRTANILMPVIVLYRGWVIWGRVGVTAVGAFPVCSVVGSLISFVDLIFLFVYGAALFVLRPTIKSMKVKPEGAKSTVVSGVDQTSTTEKE
mmetsp:Transcript_20632/g.43000  ORF Transcript_20632/g.43000 Transcript_20632/m.43000 type:complete len:371 (+) Transcript_20632:85-1197(+)